jgi:hypothetical protein
MLLRLVICHNTNSGAVNAIVARHVQKLIFVFSNDGVLRKNLE